MLEVWCLPHACKHAQVELIGSYDEPTPQENPHKFVAKTESNIIEKCFPFMERLKSPPLPQEAGNQWDTHVQDKVKAILYAVVC